jgi:hypothetical protein
MAYLTNMPSDVLNNYGLTKTLLTRRETIFLKHVLKNTFVYGSEKEFEEILTTLKFKSPFEYMSYMTNRLRGIYKLPRHYAVENVDDIVKQSRHSFFKTIELYAKVDPVFVLDYSSVVMNKQFHPVYTHLAKNFRTIIVSDKIGRSEVECYLAENGLPLTRHIFGKNKITRLRNIGFTYTKKVLFYLDDDNRCLNLATILAMHCYRYQADGKVYSHTGFIR